MKANLNCGIQDRPVIRSLVLGALLLLAGLPGAWAQTITSDPADGATGVSVSGPITFTFSSAVDPTQTTATFYSMSPPGAYPVNSVWSAGNTVLTCTPISSFPANATINWSVVVTVSPMPVFALGSFSTGTGGGTTGGGSGTNAITSFSVGKLYLYEQATASLPTLMSNAAYGFLATVALKSNITATAVTVTIPGASAATSLTQNFVAHEDYYFFDYNTTNETAFEAAYPQGNYAFKITGNSNLQATVSMPTTMLQPNAPHVSNFTNAQAVDATKAFTVTWDPFQGGTSSDFIGLSVSDDGGEVFHTPYPGTNGAVLPGTALSAVIPLGVLSAGTNYQCQLVFYRFLAVTNSTYATVGYRASGTSFNLSTTGGVVAPAPVVSNPIMTPGNIGFDVATAAGQALKVLFSADCSLPISQWQTVLSTNSPGASVHLNLSIQGGANGFYRLANGP